MGNQSWWKTLKNATILQWTLVWSKRTQKWRCSLCISVSDGLTLETMKKKNVTHKTQRRDKSVPSRITFCFEPSAFTGSASPSRSVPLKPSFCRFGALFHALLRKTRLRKLSQCFPSLKKNFTVTPVSFGTGVSEDSQKTLWACTRADTAWAESVGAFCLCSGHEYAEKVRRVCCITGMATNFGSWAMRATNDWHFYRQERVDRREISSF